eukprot:TRINITY_DN12442_c0_g2_i2.p1 TRINITY_DN12442_c0_g2~~TRINITY_DN12442_c0_g2_i2.p1  ORF type:complete len:106 (+),score=8.97 TRINITY_DN12442_c0_g2_i2:68-385(+)
MDPYLQLRAAAKIIQKQIKSVIEQLVEVQGGYTNQSFLNACEKVAPSKYLVTGGALMEFFIMAYGSPNDSRLLIRFTSNRKRQRLLASRSESQIATLMSKYTLRY